VTTRPPSGPRQASSTARAIAAEALPAPITTSLPAPSDSGDGSCGAMQSAGWALATAASNIRRSNARGSRTVLT
jgi:hypothetical protein